MSNSEGWAVVHAEMTPHSFGGGWLRVTWKKRGWGVLAIVAMLAAVTVGLPALAAPRSGAASGTGHDPGLHTGAAGIGSLPSFADRSRPLIRLEIGAFDPLTDSVPGNAKLPSVAESSLPLGVAQYYLVQVRDGRYAEAHDAITRTGATTASVVPDDTYVVRATPAQRLAFAKSPAVRWVGFDQPAWRVAMGVNGLQGPLDLTGTNAYRVHAFRHDPDAASLAQRLAAIPGVSVLDDGGVTVDVSTTAARLPAVAAIPFVEWVTQKPVYVTLNKEARWVVDTGVRDLYWSTAPNGAQVTRLSGAGQTAGDADTGLNYKPDQNGHAHVAFRDCSDAAGTICKDADYTQQAPGTATAQMLAVQANNAGSPNRKMSAFFDLTGIGPNPPDPDAHGTHTAGSITGDDGVYGRYDGNDGLAPAARLVFQAIAGADGSLNLPADYYQLFRQAYHPSDPTAVDDSGSAPCTCGDGSYVPVEDARTHNNSYGSGLPLVSLGDSITVDQFVWDHEDMSIAIAAGNSGPAAGTISDPATAKNGFASGATPNGRQLMQSIDNMTNFSSHGPTADGRFGVTVADPGEEVISAKGGTVDGYHYAQGTSMSTPILTGALTLMRQYFWDGYGPTDGKGFPGGQPSGARHDASAALLKAASANGAERMTGWYTGDDGDKAEAQLRGQYPSGGQGFGRLTMANSLYFKNDPANNWYWDVYRNDPEAFAVGAGDTRTYTIHVADGTPLDVTMAYTDAPDALPVGTPAIVNDLNLDVTGPNGETYVGNNFNSRTNPSVADAETPNGQAAPDAINNIEKVRVAHPAAGDYTVTVSSAKVLDGPQGFALTAHGAISAPSTTFAAGPARQHDVPGKPTISNVAITPVSADLSKVTFDTNEPTTATATTKVTTEDHTFTDVMNLGTEGYYGLPTPPVETSARTADLPVVGTHHEIYLTGFTAGTAHTLQVAATDLGGSPPTVVSKQFTTADNVYQPAAADTGQLNETQLTGFEWNTGKQLYAGNLSGGALGAFMFRIPTSVDPSTITGAEVELTTAHDWVSNENDDSTFTVDLLDDTVKPNWGTQLYADIHNAPAAARVPAETAAHIGAQQTSAFTFACADINKLRASLSAVTNGQRLAPFRWDSFSPTVHGVYSAEFGYNRRSRGLEFRPKLVLTTTKSKSPQPPLAPCDTKAPAPKISDVGIHSTATPGNITVTWRTDTDSDSTVLFRPKGSKVDFTQVGTPARSKLHQVEVRGLDPAQHYEFGVRSTSCNGKQTTDDNGGHGYDLYLPPIAPPPTFYFSGSTWGTDAPTGAVPSAQTATGLSDPTVADDSASIVWSGDVPAMAAGQKLDFDWWISSANGQVFGTTGDLTLWRDGTKVYDQLFGLTIGQGPQENHTSFTLTDAIAAGPLTMQIATPYINNDITVTYGDAGDPSRFSVQAVVIPPTAGPRPPGSANATNLNLARVATRSHANATDVTAGTGRC